MVSTSIRKLKYFSLNKQTKKPLTNLDNVSPTSSGVETFKTGRREVPGSKTGRACQPSHSKFSVDFFETRVNKG